MHTAETELAKTKISRVKQPAIRVISRGQSSTHFRNLNFGVQLRNNTRQTLRSAHTSQSGTKPEGSGPAIEDLVRIAEAEASCELWGLLKRPDEKFVTERAYDNPKFVEDLVRDVAGRLKADARIKSFVVEAENFESIHNHSAYALIQSD